MNAPTRGEDGTRCLPPWLASALLKRGDLAPRFVYWRQRLAQQSRGWRRRLRRQLAVGVTGAALLLAVAGAGAQIDPAAPDGTITVVNGQVNVLANGQCSLIEAIQNANNKTNGRPNADCAAGNPSGADTINLPSNGLFTLNSAMVPDAEVGPIGLPWISTPMTINGNGSTIQRANSAPDFRIMAVGQQGNLTLNNTTVRNGFLFIGDELYYQYYGKAGAGILNQGQLTISSSTIADNVAMTTEYSTAGGGIYNHGTLTITGSTIVDNVANGHIGGSGGGIGGSGDLTIIDSVISGNKGVASRFGYGGGVNTSGSLTIVDSIFRDNQADAIYFAGGGAIVSYGIAEITGSTFVDNTALSDYPYDNYVGGGAVWNRGAMTIANSTLTGNQSDNEGGGVANYGDLTLINSTITNNSNGVYARCWPSFGNSVTRLQRTLVSGNGGNEVKRIAGSGCTATVIANSHNLFGTSGNANVSGFTPGPTDIVPTVGLSAILSPLANNGGPTQTHALPAGSPALDRAPNSSCTAAPVNGVDQRGQPRNQNGSGAASANECDVGAFERAGSAPPPVGAFYLSPGKAGTFGGVAFAPADIIRFDPAAGWSMFFDGSDVGLAKNVSAFELQADGSVLLSLGATQSVAGVGSVAAHDVLRFVPNATGNNTSGTFQMWVDGSNVGLTTSAERIDALGLAADGRIAVSTFGAVAVAGPGGATLKAANEDALGFNRANATWSAFFDPTSVPGMAAENVNALWVNPTTGEVYIALADAFNFGGVAGDAKDIVKLTPSGGGYTPSLYWDGSAAGFPVAIDGLEMGN
jgi:hypothetical protein